MRSMRVVGLAVVFVSLMVNAVSAQLIADTTRQAASGRLEVGAALSVSEIAYELDNSGGSGDIQRTILGGYAALGLSDQLDVYGAIGIIAKSEADDSNDSGTGFLLAGGGRLDLMEINVVDVSAYAQLEMISEDYGDGIDGTLMEIAAGVVGTVAVNDQISVFGAVDIFPYSDGEIEAMGFKVDFERDSLFGLRAGGTLELGQIWLRGEIAIVGETAVTVGAGTSF